MWFSAMLASSVYEFTCLTVSEVDRPTITYRTSDIILGPPILAYVGPLTWLFRRALHHSLENRLDLSLPSMAM